MCSRLNENFEEKEGVTLNHGDVYDHYLEMCSLRGCNALDQWQLSKVTNPNLSRTGGGGTRIRERSSNTQSRVAIDAGSNSGFGAP